MLKATKKGVINTGEVWNLTIEDKYEIAKIFNESMSLDTPKRGHDLRWSEREKSPIRDSDNYPIPIEVIDK